jgi:hypothetical protein
MGERLYSQKTLAVVNGKKDQKKGSPAAYRTAET